ncbi:(2E,6E)-farnesyl diphosphate synthase [Chromohalobacter canadensis]|uniref:(2E,6E)-farnesyl diphosphate synthase n=1 Tax=Chromohalobacter canadensis TaxID=141389 RepID=UPI0021BE23CB|nr:farnesyl diphosphate synthase [Chromohalobacter canadensis]MCT8468981.1 (2E,6E)-farnesyl diphosphate synthase [Chromohalobacter canadensis]MCT8472829.1 (2E,6E)-farnesyl diphosphate synthase [Chromohalobacter canadensis]MCT8500281.1 (2E,6E)-farnesyl diphosphate synthase [Chromohalobacter canadensis]
MVSVEPLAERDIITTARARTEHVLARVFERTTPVAGELDAAMRYGVLGGGKRLRPVLVYAAGRALGAEDTALDAPAAAIELIHAYSLIHDDLPAMDDDDMRRGRPTVHRVYNEAMAILTGDALQTLAFEVLAEARPTRLGAMVGVLAHASGRDGMAAGQALDLCAVGGQLDVDALATMHRYKTGALIRAAVRLGALAAVDEDDPRVAALDAYAAAIGLAFQIQDDILDVAGDAATLGKATGADAARAKPTYPALLGLEGARAKAHGLLDEALDALAPLGERAFPLADLARHMIDRDH